MNSDDLPAPTDVRDFLRSRGWRLIPEGIPDRLYVLDNPKFPRRQLAFPMDQSAPDYIDAIDSFLDKAAELAMGSRAKVLTEVAVLRDDVLRLRIAFGGKDSSLPMSFASLLLQSTEKLLKAAACTVLRPRLHHPRLALAEAAQFVDRTRFGQTEVGSFIVKVSCPINAMEVQGTLDFQSQDEDPFVRQVTLTLHSAIAQLTSAIESDTLDLLVGQLKDSSTPLVSSNLCDALVGLHDDHIDNSVDFSFGWSPLRAVPTFVSTRPLSIARDYFSRIEDVRRELRAVEMRERRTFIGTVERLDGEIDAHGRRSGLVVLSLLVEDQSETIRAGVVLGPDEYAQADRAHMTHGAYVRLTGQLQPGRQPRRLTDLSQFEVLDQVV